MKKFGLAEWRTYICNMQLVTKHLQNVYTGWGNSLGATSATMVMSSPDLLLQTFKDLLPQPLPMPGVSVPVSWLWRKILKTSDKAKECKPAHSTHKMIRIFNGGTQQINSIVIMISDPLHHFPSLRDAGDPVQDPQGSASWNQHWRSSMHQLPAHRDGGDGLSGRGLSKVR